jgi:hypothetical protein
MHACGAADRVEQFTVAVGRAARELLAGGSRRTRTQERGVEQPGDGVVAHLVLQGEHLVSRRALSRTVAPCGVLELFLDLAPACVAG